VTNPLSFLALDLGAESGRAILSCFDGQRLQLSEIHRFPNGPVRLPDGLHWDILRLWSEVKQGIALAIRNKESLASIGIDTWAVDYGLLDRSGALLSNPYHYRDSRTDGMLEEAFRRVPREEIFRQTGIQFLQLNSLYQILSMVTARSPVLDIADTFLTIPDLLNYWLTGRAVCEFSNATTTQCYNPREAEWAREMLQRLGIPTHIFPPIVPPGTDLGRLLPRVADEVGLERHKGPHVIAPACHDTGSAVAAVPALAPDFAWISSGTWSVVGTEVPDPVINEESLAYNFTNEGGVCDTRTSSVRFRFSRNVMGLWLVQECRRTWAQQGQEYSYDALTEMASEAEPFQAVLDPDYGEFFKPGDMPARIQAYCRLTHQPVPQTKGSIVRCALEGIALKYRWVLERLEEMLGRRLAPLYIVGGGTQNRLLSQFTANAVGRQVITGPVEATASGNILMQMMALGHIDSLAEGRQILRKSFELQTYDPGDRQGWEEAYGRLLARMATACESA
jgi:rhamnulokinase